MMNEASIGRRLLSGLGSRLAGQVMQIALKLAEVPIFVHFWGAAGYGVWLLTNSIASLLALSDLGISGPASRKTIGLVAKGDFQASSTFFYGTNGLVLVISATISSMVVLLSVYASSAFGILNVPWSTSTTLLVLSCLSMSTVLSFAVQNLYSASESTGHYATGYVVMAATSAARVLASFGAVAMGANPGEVAMVLLAGQIAALAVQWLWTRKRVSWLHIKPGRISAADAIELWRPASAQVMLSGAQFLAYEAPRLVIGAVLSPAAVVAFVTHRQFARLALLIGTLNAPFIAEMAIKSGRGDREGFRRLALASSQAMTWLCGALIVALAVTYSTVFPVWTRGAVPLNGVLISLLLLGTYLELLWRNAFAPLYATNRHLPIAISYLFASCAALLLCALLGRVRGIAGAAVAVTLLDGVVLLAALIFVARELGITTSQWIRGSTAPPRWMAARLVEVVLKGRQI
jgi:O-antigen/teichoic acid export membrane protein